jgi:DNA repair exonuclease SbcCD nuclease subunit
MKPYGLISDTHHHNWSAFATTLENGVNSRLQALLNEAERCAHEVRKAGGDTIIHAGDMFHVRGSIAPSVLNPTLDCYREIVDSGIRVIILAGNHDLEGKDSNRLGSAITALEGVGCRVFNNTTEIDGVTFAPWHNSVADLKKTLEGCDADLCCDLIIHAPIDNVIAGIPDHGLDAAYLNKLGFRRVFAGHYHNHKDFGNNVYSIGALAHHTWSDIDSKAGFLIVSDEGVRWHKSHAPEFVEITAETDPAELALTVDGNYCRAKISSTKQKDVEELRAFLIDNGAKGVTILAQKEASVSARTGSTVSAGASLEVSVADFIKAQSYANPEKLAILCQNILTETRGAA